MWRLLMIRCAEIGSSVAVEFSLKFRSAWHRYDLLSSVEILVVFVWYELPPIVSRTWLSW